MNERRGSGKNRENALQWRRADLHIHTPASACYHAPDVTYLQILQRAESRGLDIIALTDHNTVAGYAALQQEIRDLLMLERLGRLSTGEKKNLAELRSVLDKLLVLPGFEFTATFGFHILGIFPEDTPVRKLEYILLELNIPPEKLDEGATEVGATSDVLTVYRVIAEAGGLVIAAHVNSNSGVAMQGYAFGGQTKVSYTQDPNLHALEVTDLESRRRRRTATFFDGSRPQYPRRMHCIQASDAHRLDAEPNDQASLGVGDRVTEVLLPEVSFKALKEVFLGDDFARTRPYRPKERPFDHVSAARQQGASIVQSFHERMTRQAGRMHAVLRDIVAFANTNGGTVYVGVSGNPKTPPVGFADPQVSIAELRAEIERLISPPIDVGIDAQRTEGKSVIRITVPKGQDAPYVLEGSNIYIRQESETSLALRDETIALIRRLIESKPTEDVEQPAVEMEEELPPTRSEPPKTGVEIVDTVERKGMLYHTLRDLRNGNEVHNVTHASARRLWRYAIERQEKKDIENAHIVWQDDLGWWRKSRRGGRVRYDLVQRDAEGNLHVYYGVTDDGIHGEWKKLVENS